MNFSSCTMLEARENLNKTQQQMADLLGVSRNYIAMIELGDKPFSEKLRRKLIHLCQPLQTDGFGGIREPGHPLYTGRLINPESPTTVETLKIYMQAEVARLNNRVEMLEEAFKLIPKTK